MSTQHRNEHGPQAATNLGRKIESLDSDEHGPQAATNLGRIFESLSHDELKALIAAGHRYCTESLRKDLKSLDDAQMLALLIDNHTFTFLGAMLYLTDRTLAQRIKDAIPFPDVDI